MWSYFSRLEYRRDMPYVNEKQHDHDKAQLLMFKYTYIVK